MDHNFNVEVLICFNIEMMQVNYAKRTVLLLIWKKQGGGISAGVKNGIWKERYLP